MLQFNTKSLSILATLPSSCLFTSPTKMYTLPVQNTALFNTYMINAILNTHEKETTGKIGLEFRTIFTMPHLNLLILKVMNET